ncbi:MAG: HlyD family secretion protein [Beijerinckiaceae bacterium]
MIQALRKRARPDNLKNQIRAGGQSFARRLYLWSVIAVIGTVVWSFTGHWFFLATEGIVWKERVVIAPDYAARVMAVHVKPGDKVVVGQPIVTLQSREILDSIAEFTTRRAALFTRESQIAARFTTIREVTPIAEERLRRARDLLAKLDGMQSSDQTADIVQRRAASLARQGQIESLLGTIRQTTDSGQRRLQQSKAALERLEELHRRQLTTAPRISEAQRDFYEAEKQVAQQRNELLALEGEATSLAASLRELDTALTQARLIASAPRQAEAQREAYEAQRELAGLRAELTSLADERDGLARSSGEVDAAIRQVQASYNNGNVVAMVEGLVGPKTPNPGQIVKSGESLLDIYRGDMFVLAYMPTSRLYSVEVADKVRVTDGQHTHPGKIMRIETVTDALPPEFQVNFRATDRQQLFRVAFDETPPFAIQAKVKLSSSWSPQGIVTLAQGWMLAAGETVHSWFRVGSPTIATR